MPAEEDGKPVFVLRDLEELTEHPLALSGGGMLLASLLDGSRTAAQVREEFRKNAGAELEIAAILGLVNALDEAGYLETPAVAAKREKALEYFRGSPKRPAMFAGTSYPAEPLPLDARLLTFFTGEKGPGKLKSESPAKPAPLGLVAPHIDFTRGGPSYAWAYQALSERKAPDVVVALGVAHASPNSPWVFTPKAYETPFGPMDLDDELYAKLSTAVWYEPRADEWVHKHEHSLEFQAVWLRYLWREKTPKWVPILVSTFERFSPDEAPSKIDTIEKGIKDLGAVLKAEVAKGRSVTVVCGIDLAHVGPRFGDDLEITPELEKKIETEDRKSLVDAMALDADGFYKSVVADGHWRKVCGLSALYTGIRLMKMIGATKPGRLLSYGQAPDPAGGVVSFASAIYDK